MFFLHVFQLRLTKAISQLKNSIFHLILKNFEMTKTLTQLCFILFSVLVTQSLLAQNTFTEKASTYNIDLDGLKDGGFSFGFLNNDEHLDLIVNTNQDSITHRTRIYFFNPATNTFDDVTSEKCLGCIADNLPGSNVMERSMVIADFNLDGYNDFVRNSSHRLEVYFNNGPSNGFSFGQLPSQTPNFVLYTENLMDANPPFGIPGGMNTEGIGVLDYDNDGDLDLFIENHNWAMEIYRNRGFGSGQFEYVPPSQTGLPAGGFNPGDGDYASVTDFNDDGFIDVIARKNEFIPYDFAVNNPASPGTFIDGVDIQNADNDNKGAVSLYDFDNDGDFDLLWTAADSTVIYRKDKVGFTPLSMAITGINANIGNQIDGSACGDIDNDGDIDIFLTNDSGPSFLFINQLNDPNLGPNTGNAFEFVLDNRGINLNADGEGAVFVDFDDDGDLDLYVNINDGPNQYWENNLNNSDFLNVKILENRDANGNFLGRERLALGATARLKNCCGNVLSGVREVNGGNGHGTQDPSIIHFGLSGGTETEYILEVRFPSYLKDGVYVRDTVELRVVPSDYPDRLVTIRASDQTDGTLVCNLPPVAVNDTFDVNVNQDFINNFMLNDSDPNDDIIKADTILVSGPTNGIVSIREDGSFIYTPNAGFTGQDQFTYSIYDPCGVKDEATVFLNILPCDDIVCTAPVANDDLFTLKACEDSIQGGVFANDSIEDCSGILSFSVLEINGIGEESFNFESFGNTGFFTFNPDASFSGSVNFIYEICTQSATCGLLCDTATVTIEVEACNECEAPIAVNDNFEFKNCDIDFSGSLSSNDTLPAGCDSLIYVLLPESDLPGTLEVDRNGRFEFKLSDESYTGSFSFEYSTYCGSCEEEQKSYDTAQVTIEVVPCITCPIPDAVSDNLTYQKCEPSFTADISLNDVSPAGCDSLLFSLDTELQAKHGVATLTENGQLTYTLNDDDFIGTDSLRYFATCLGCESEVGKADTAWISITIIDCDTPTCFKPVLNVDIFNLQNCENTQLSGNVSINDEMPFGCDSLVFGLIGSSTTSFRSIDFQADGSFTYEVTDNSFIGTDTLSYFAYCYTCEGESSAYDTTSVVFNVEPCVCPVPNLENDRFTRDNCVAEFNFDLTINDINPSECDSLLYQIVDYDNGVGTASISDAGILTYNLNDPNFTGIDTLYYAASCNSCTENIQDTARVVIEILPCCTGNPLLETDIYTISCQTMLNGNISLNDNKTEDCSNIIYQEQLIIRPKEGTFSLSSDGSFTYTLFDSLFVGADTIVYNAVCESCENTPSAFVQDTIIINVEPCDTFCPPLVANNDFYALNDCSNANITGNFSANDVVPAYCNSVTYELLQEPTKGSIQLNTDGSFNYTPNTLLDNSTDTLLYIVTCESEACGIKSDTAQVIFESNCCEALCDVPVANNDALSISGCVSTTLEFSAIENDVIDIDCENISFALVGGNTTALGATVTINEQGTITYQSPYGLENPTTDEFEYTICNDCGICDTATVTVDIEVLEFKIYELVTPNDDQKNDILWIDGIECYPDNTVKIFNRWGNLVFEINGYENNLENGWYGQVNKNSGIAVGQTVPDGTYLCIVDLGNGEQSSKYVEVRGSN